MKDIISLSWTIFIIYWIVSSRSTKPDLEVKWRMGTLQFISGVIVIGYIFYYLISGNSIHLPIEGHPVFPIQLIGSLITIVGLVIAIMARRKLADNWSGTVTFKKDHELMTTGIYGYVRHPIYSGVLLMGLGTVLFYGTINAFIIWLVMVMVLLYKLHQEERLMTKHFPEIYPGYKQRVKALIPFLL